MLKLSEILHVEYSSDDPAWDYLKSPEGEIWVSTKNFCAVFRNQPEGQFYAAASIGSTHFTGPYDSLEAAKLAAEMLGK